MIRSARCCTWRGAYRHSAGNELLSQLEHIENALGQERTGGREGGRGGVFDLKDVHHRAAQATATLARMEHETRNLEAELASSW